MKLEQIYDSSKRGTIVIGAARSGTHHISSLISLELRKNNITTPAVKPEEFFYDLSEARDIMIGEIDYLDRKIPWSREYIVGSIVSPYARIALHKYLQQNFHIIRVIRKDVMAHLMSVIIHKKITLLDQLASNRVTAEQFNGIFKDGRYTVTPNDIYYFVSQLIMDKTNAVLTIVYEDYMSINSEEVKSQVTISPVDFLTNYDEAKMMLHNIGLV